MAVKIIIVITIILVILLSGHTLLYSMVVSVFGIPEGSTLMALRILFGILGFSFVAASIISMRDNGIATRAFYRVSAVWLGLFFYLLLASFIYHILLLPFFGLSTITLISCGEMLFGLAIAVTLYGTAHAADIHVTNITVPLPNIPEVWKSRRAVWVSDIHLGQVRGVDFAKLVVESVQKLNPEIVFIGGDLYDGVKVDATEIIKPFAALHPPLGVYFITGNHEEFSAKAEENFVTAIRAIGIKTLMNERVVVDGVQIVGVDYESTVHKTQYQSVLEKISIDPAMPSILLRHVPSHNSVAEKAGISFQISGHTHRAQMFPLSLIPPLVYGKYSYGLHRHGPMHVFTSDGVGTWGPPLRVGTNAEIVEIHFEASEKDIQ